MLRDELSFPLITSDTIWIVWDSIIRRAESRFDLPVNVHWNGKGGACLPDVYDLRDELGRRFPPPACLFVHLGTNDLVKVDDFFC